MIHDLKDKRRGGFYFQGEIPFVSVTTVIDVLDKPGLTYWQKQQVYLAMVKDPTLKEQEALSAPYKVTGDAQERGKTIHSMIEAYKNTGKMPDYIPEEYKGYARAFESWVKDFSPNIIENEKSVFSNLYKYAGTLDMLLKVAQSPTTAVLDIKTGSDLYDTVWLQLSAYKYALMENGTDIGDTYALLLKEDGSYKFEKGQDEFRYFLAALDLYKFRNRKKLEKLGYQV